jgi:2,3-bisphosphoglycerate-dependent phosphoglycerate mutase
MRSLRCVSRCHPEEDVLESNLMQLYIIRHAQSTNNALADQRYRVSDPLLTETGLRQAELLADHLARGSGRFTPGTNPAGGTGYGITRIYCSPMRRTLQTARPVYQALGLAPEIWVEIHEYGGIWLEHNDDRGIRGYPGLTRSEIEAELPGCVLPEGVTEHGWWRGAQEEPEPFLARAAWVTDTLHSWAGRDERIAIITHGAFIDGLLNTLLKVARVQPVYYHHDNTGITFIDFRREGRLSIRFLNRLDHLPPEMITS